MADLKVSKYVDQVSCKRIGIDCSRSNEQETNGRTWTYRVPSMPCSNLFEILMSNRIIISIKT